MKHIVRTLALSTGDNNFLLSPKYRLFGVQRDSNGSISIVVAEDTDALDAMDPTYAEVRIYLAHDGEVLPHYVPVGPAWTGLVPADDRWPAMVALAWRTYEV